MSQPELDAAAVAAWIRAHPGFLAERPELIADLHIPHGAGGSVSLVERQLGLLRERNTTLRHQLDTLLDAARANDRLFALTRAMVLDLVDAPTRDVAPRAARHLRDEFAIDEVAIIVHAAITHERAGARVVEHADTQAAVGHLLGNRVLCGHLREVETMFLFGRTRRPVASAAVIALGQGGEERQGVLALGSHDTQRFASGSDTLFVQFIADILHRLLARAGRERGVAADVLRA